MQHVTAYMGSPLLWLFTDPANVTWVKPSGSMDGNGMGWGQLSHTLAWALKASGVRPTSVFAFMKHCPTTGADIYDAVSIMCENGATMTITGVATLPGHSPKSSKQIDNKIFGSLGFVSYSGDDGDVTSGSLLMRRHDGRQIVHKGFQFENCDTGGIGPESLQVGYSHFYSDIVMLL